MRVALVFATGTLRNLTHVYAGDDGTSRTGFRTFLVGGYDNDEEFFGYRQSI